MKPMLKAAFFSLVNDLLARGIKPELKGSTITSYGFLKWTDGDSSRVEDLYAARDCSPLTASFFRKRFKAWFAEIMNKHQEQLVADAGIVAGSLVWDKLFYKQRIVTEVCAGGELVLDGEVTRTLDEVIHQQPAAAPHVPADAPEHDEMNVTAAIQHMAHTLAGAIEQSNQPDFIASEAYADIKTNYEHVATSCKDLAIVVWLKNHLCFGYVGEECTFTDVNKPYLDQFNHILQTGWRPGAAPAHKMLLSNMFEMEWWGAQNIVVTGHTGDQVTGTATMSETEGEYQIAFDWLMDMGEEAERVGLPAVVSITAGRFTLPYEFSLVETDGRPLDALEAIQEMDFALGFCADIFNELYDTYAPAEGAHQ